jgi:hypothetical protein
MEDQQRETEMADDLRSFLNPTEAQSQRVARKYGAKVEAYGGEVEEASSSIDTPKVSAHNTSLPTEPPPAPVGEWFYLYQGETKGPVTERTIRELGTTVWSGERVCLIGLTYVSASSRDGTFLSTDFDFE